MGRARIVEPAGDQDVIKNLRGVDPAAFDALATRVQALIECANAATAALAQATERSAVASGDAAAATARLDERLRLGARLLKALKLASASAASDSLPSPLVASNGAMATASSSSSQTAVAAEASPAHDHKAQRQSLATRCGEAESARAAAEQTVRNRGEMLAGVADELASPLATLAHVVAALGEETERQERHQQLNVARQCLEEVNALLRSVVELTQADAAVDPPGPGLFDVRRTIQAAADAAVRRAEERNIKLACELAADVPVLAQGDAGRLRQALLYITNTVIKTAAEGEIALTAKVDHKTDQYALIRCEIGCMGAGVSQAQIDAVNAAVAAADPSADAQPARSGLGLAVARKLVELMQGTIGVDAEAGRLLRVWFTARLDAPPPGADERRAGVRLLQESLMCSLGHVLDLSIGGMRIRASRALEGEHEVELKDAEEPLTLKAQVAWCHRMGFRKYQVGLLFLDTTPEQRQHLTRLATRNSYRCALPQNAK